MKDSKEIKSELTTESGDSKRVSILSLILDIANNPQQAPKHFECRGLNEDEAIKEIRRQYDSK